MMTLTLGRDARNQINIAIPAVRQQLQITEPVTKETIESVGREHLRITLQEDTLTKEEIIVIEEPEGGTTNGTAVNGRYIQRFVLQAGLIIEVGALSFSSTALMDMTRKLVYADKPEFERQFLRLIPAFEERARKLERIDLTNLVRTYTPAAMAGIICAIFQLYTVAAILAALLAFVFRLLYKESKIRIEKDKVEAHFSSRLRCPNPACNRPLVRTLHFYRDHKSCEYCKAVYFR